jgi:hypothetical protein
VTTQQIPQRAARLYAIWGKLPDTPLSEDELHAAILKALNRSGPGHEADCSAFRHLLVGCEAVAATRDAAGEVTYQKAPEFPTWPENGPGTASYDAHLRELAEEEQAVHDRAAAEVLGNSPQNRQRQELDAHIRQVVREVIRVELPLLVRQHIDQAETSGAHRGAPRQDAHDAGRWRVRTRPVETGRKGRAR